MFQVQLVKLLYMDNIWDMLLITRENIYNFKPSVWKKRAQGAFTLMHLHWALNKDQL